MNFSLFNPLDFYFVLESNCVWVYYLVLMSNCYVIVIWQWAGLSAILDLEFWYNSWSLGWHLLESCGDCQFVIVWSCNSSICKSVEFLI